MKTIGLVRLGIMCLGQAALQLSSSLKTHPRHDRGLAHFLLYASCA